MKGCTVSRDPRLIEAKKPASTAEEIGGYIWAPTLANRAPKEEPLKINDHGMDALRYMIAELDGLGTYSAGACLKQVVSSARQAIGAIFPRWGGGGYGRYSIVLPNARYDYETQAGDLWQTSIIAIGIKWLGDRFPRPIFRVSKIGRGGKYTPYGQHPLADLWNQPNPYYGRRTLEKAIGLS
jgi:hypothetical protein